ncbi:MAG: D-alanine--D-alanine ligase [Patescibacteria group bacterium]|nr:D-alanine--D-alanine ligase [Patescibacteria group bacterium]MDE1965959.1 D-alanine--D-alanine ligase [Patescibacteria group bacterium]
MHGTVIGVLRGGPSREHDVSLKTGAAIAANLPPERFTVRDIYIDRNGTWHDRGVPTTPDRALRMVDAVLLGLHGEYGEDGEVQKLLERLGIPYAGADSFASFRAMHKLVSKEAARDAGLLVPEYRYITAKDDIDAGVREIIRTFHQPVVVKPVRWGSSVGVSIVGGYAPVYAAIEELFEQGADGVLVEERIVGMEVTAGIVERLRGEALYALPIVEILPPRDAGFFSAAVKYTGETREICPARIPQRTARALMANARAIHAALGIRHYSRSDFIVTPQGAYYLETNTLPGMTEESLLPKSLMAVGVSFPDFLSHLVALSLDAPSASENEPKQVFSDAKD